MEYSHNLMVESGGGMSKIGINWTRSRFGGLAVSGHISPIWRIRPT